MKVPADVEEVPDERDEMHTKDVFRQCVGHVFRVRGVGTNSPHEDTGHLELWARRGVDCGNIARADVIWVEPDCVEIVADPRSTPMSQ